MRFFIAGKPSSGKMKSLVALTLVLASATGSMLQKKIHHDLAVMNDQAMCWGVGNMFYYKIAMMKAQEECMTGHSSSIKPANPFAQLNRPKNPFQTLPASIQAKNPFSGGNSVSLRYFLLQKERGVKSKTEFFSSTRSQPSTLTP